MVDSNFRGTDIIAVDLDADGDLDIAGTGIENGGLCGPELAEQLTALIDKAGLPVREALPDDDTLLGAMRHDKKVRDDRTAVAVRFE